MKMPDEMKSYYQNKAEEKENEQKAIFDEYLTKHAEIFNQALELRNKFITKAQEYLNNEKLKNGYKKLR
ncbi:MAG: hypothetical protein R2809_10875 [Flavobacteriales bacterium]